MIPLVSQLFPRSSFVTWSRCESVLLHSGLPGARCLGVSLEGEGKKLRTPRFKRLSRRLWKRMSKPVMMFRFGSEVRCMIKKSMMHTPRERNKPGGTPKLSHRASQKEIFVPYRYAIYLVAGLLPERAKQQAQDLTRNGLSRAKQLRHKNGPHSSLRSKLSQRCGFLSKLPKRHFHASTGNRTV